MRNQVLLDYFNNKVYLNRIAATAVIELLTKCNLKCEHCYIPKHNSWGLSTEQLKALLIQLRNMGTVNVLFTGGEIFLRKDIFELIEFARKLHLRVTLLSNATLLNDELIHSLAELYITEFSTTIFSMNKSVNDSITQVSGSLEQILENVRKLSAAGIKTKIKMPVMKKNASSYDDVRAFCDATNLEFMPTFSISSKMNGEQLSQDLRIEMNDLKDILAKSGNKSFLDKTSLPGKKHPCAALFCSCSISCNGDVYPCNSIPYKIGNILENDIKWIWENSQELKYIQNIKKEDLKECTTCKYEPFCDRCPGMALLEGGSLLACDPLAKKVAKARMENTISNGRFQ